MAERIPEVEWQGNLGYVKLFRKSLYSEVFADPNLWHLWTWCMMKANHEKNFVKIHTGNGDFTIPVNPGQFVFGRKSASEKLGISESTIWRRMKKLVEKGNISLFSNRHYSIVSLCNWQLYQEQDFRSEQASNKHRTSIEQASDTDKNEENEENDKKVSTAGERTPKSQKPTQPTLEEVKAYCEERAGAGHPRIDPAAFHARYASVGWLDKNGQPIRNWRAFVWRWELGAEEYDNKPL